MSMLLESVDAKRTDCLGSVEDLDDGGFNAALATQRACAKKLVIPQWTGTN